MPLNNPSKAVEIKTGTYTGDDTVNRAIPHGLSKTPKLVLIIVDSARGVIIGGEARLHSIDAANQHHVVTAPDSTNFYVGNATSYVQSCNTAGGGYTYRWVAMV
ncbi:hypothetical protein ES703_84987 [subsurface metagenome]